MIKEEKIFFYENEENHGEKKKLLKEEKQTKKGEKRLPKIVTNMRHAACLPTNECLSGFEYVLK